MLDAIIRKGNVVWEMLFQAQTGKATAIRRVAVRETIVTHGIMGEIFSRHRSQIFKIVSKQV